MKNETAEDFQALADATGEGTEALEAVEPVQPLVKPVTRPVAPDSLTEAQAEFWEKTVNNLPEDFFPQEVLPLLKNYCIHIDEADYISTVLNAWKAKGVDWTDQSSIKFYDKMIAKRDSEVRAATSIATKLRFTTQSTRSENYRRINAPASSSDPWEYNGEDDQ